MKIGKAMAQDLPAVAEIYEKIHKAEEAGLLSTGWVRDIYPTRKTAEDALRRGDLFVLNDSGIQGAAIINQNQLECYQKGQWQFEAPRGKVMVLHTLVIDPDKSGKGFGRQFVKFYADYAQANACPYLRMDTNANNQRARDMYRKYGFKEVGIVPVEFNGIAGTNLVLLERMAAQ